MCMAEETNGQQEKKRTIRIRGWKLLKNWNEEFFEMLLVQTKSNAFFPFFFSFSLSFKINNLTELPLTKRLEHLESERQFAGFWGNEKIYGKLTF